MGRNSIGKSSILSALSMVASFHGRIIHDTAIQALMNNAIKNKELKQEYQSLYGDNFQNYIQYLNNNIDNHLRNKEGEFFDEFLKTQQSLITNIFESYNKDETKNIEIEVEFDDEGKRLLYKCSLSPDGIIDSNVEMISGDGQVDSKAMVTSISQYWSGVLVPSFRLEANDGLSNTFSMFANSVYNSKGLQYSLDIILAIKGEQRLTKILKMCDPRISSIKVVEVNKRKIVEKVYIDNKPKKVFVLSDGTKKFIDILSSIFQTENIGGKLVLIDEIELNMHKELVNALKVIMIALFEKKGMQFIFTTHNPLMLEEFMDHKQIFSLDIVDDKHVATKISSFMKPMQSVVKQYQKGFVSPYPDEELIRNVAIEVI